MTLVIIQTGDLPLFIYFLSVLCCSCNIFSKWFTGFHIQVSQVVFSTGMKCGRLLCLCVHRSSSTSPTGCGRYESRKRLQSKSKPLKERTVPISYLFDYFWPQTFDFLSISLDAVLYLLLCRYLTHVPSRALHALRSLYLSDANKHAWQTGRLTPEMPTLSPQSTEAPLSHPKDGVVDCALVISPGTMAGFTETERRLWVNRGYVPLLMSEPVPTYCSERGRLGVVLMK